MRVYDMKQTADLFEQLREVNKAQSEALERVLQYIRDGGENGPRAEALIKEVTALTERHAAIHSELEKHRID